MTIYLVVDTVLDREGNYVLSAHASALSAYARVRKLKKENEFKNQYVEYVGVKLEE